MLYKVTYINTVFSHSCYMFSCYFIASGRLISLIRMSGWRLNCSCVSECSLFFVPTTHSSVCPFLKLNGTSKWPVPLNFNVVAKHLDFYAYAYYFLLFILSISYLYFFRLFIVFHWVKFLIPFSFSLLYKAPSFMYSCYSYSIMTVFFYLLK